MRSPAEYYLVFLLAQTRKVGATFERAQQLDLPLVTVPYLQELWSGIAPVPESVSFPGQPGLGGEALRWLQAHKIRTIWTDVEVLQGIQTILGRPRLRDFVESCILAGYRPEEVAELLSDDIRQRVTAAVIRWYRHYVYNLSHFSTDDLVTFLASKPSPVYLSLWRNRGDAAKDFVLHFHGILPVESTVESAGKQAVRMIHERLFLMNGFGPSPDDAKMLRSYTTALKNASDVMGTADEAAQEVKKILDRIVLDVDDDDQHYESEVVTYHDLVARHQDSEGAADDDVEELPEQQQQQQQRHDAA